MNDINIHMTGGEYNKYFNQAFETNDVAILRKMFQLFDISTDSFDINNRTNTACRLGHLDIVKFLTTSTELKSHVNSRVQDDVFLVAACEGGQLEVVKFLLTSPELNERADINAKRGAPLQFAAKYGHLNVVEYLLTAPELTKHADIHSGCDSAFFYACEFKQFEVINYLLFSPNLKDHAYMHASDLQDGVTPFGYACRNNNLSVINYFLYDLNIEVGDKYRDELKKDIKDEKQLTHILNLIEKRDLFVKINHGLSEPTQSRQKNKI